MTTETIKTTGEAAVIEVSSYSYTLFTEKLAELNKKLAKWGLEQATVISREYRMHDMAAITGYEEDAGSMVYRWHMMVQVPVAHVGIDGYTLVGKLEDLGAGQKIVSAIVSDISKLPTCPVERNSYGEYKTREDELEGQKWFNTVYLPAYAALQAENLVKVETLRGATMDCIHCHTTRARKATLVFETTEGKLVQVGTKCAKDYFGVDLQRALSGTWDFIERCGGTPKHFNPEQFREDFYLCLHLITRYGYVSRKVEESYRDNARFVPASVLPHQKLSTTNMVYEVRNHTESFWSILSREDVALLAGKDVAAMNLRNVELHNAAPNLSDDTSPEACTARTYAMAFLGLSLAAAAIQKNNGPETFTDYAAAYFLARATKPENFTKAYADAMNFWSTLVPAEVGGFESNVKAVAMAEANKSLAMTSMVALKWLEATREIEKPGFFVPAHRTQFPKLPADVFLGEIGKMINVELTVTMRRSGGGDYDQPWFMVKGRTAENVSVSFFCKRSLFEGAQEGTTLKVRGKVKNHEVYQDAKNTVLFFVKEA